MLLARQRAAPHGAVAVAGAGAEAMTGEQQQQQAQQAHTASSAHLFSGAEQHHPQPRAPQPAAPRTPACEYLSRVQEHRLRVQEHLSRVQEHLSRVQEHLLRVQEHLSRVQEHLFCAEEQHLFAAGVGGFLNLRHQGRHLVLLRAHGDNGTRRASTGAACSRRPRAHGGRVPRETACPERPRGAA